MGVHAKAGLDKGVLNWLYLGIILIFLMVMLGGYTRLTQSGLSMVDWQPIMGAIPPLSEGEWEESFEMYKASPEFKKLNYNYTLADYKRIYWPEYLHRLFGRLIGLAFVIPFVFFLIRRRIPSYLIKWCFLILGLGAFQGLLGWFMVKSGLTDEPRVSHFRLAAHLLTAFCTICVVYWTSLRLRFPNGLSVVKSPFRRWSFIFMALLILQIIYGAFVAGKDAGLIHNTWPLMDGYSLHPAATSLKPFILNVINHPSMLQFIHRTLAIFVLVFGVLMWWQGRRRGVITTFQKALDLLALVLFLQFVLGVITLLFRIPVWAGLLHQSGALVLLLATVYLIYHTMTFSAKPN